MKIAYVYSGPNKQYVHVINELAKFKNVEVYFISHNISEPELSKKVKCVKVSRVMFGLGVVNSKTGVEVPIPIYYKGLNKALDSVMPDVIIVNEFYRLFFWQVLAYQKKHSNIKLFLYTELKSYAKQLYRKFFTYLLLKIVDYNAAHIHRVLVYSKASNDFLVDKLPWCRISVVPSTVDCKQFYPVKNKKYFVNNKLKALIVARMVKFKRYNDLLKTVHFLKFYRNISSDDFVLTIRGDGPLDAKIRGLVKKYNIDDLVVFAPKTPYNKMRGLFIQHDVLILPSYNEGIGIVVPQAMACGIPVISSDSVGANEFLCDKFGIFETGNVYELASVILMHMSKSVLRRRGIASQKHIKKHYTADIIAKQLYKKFEGD